MTCFNVLAGRKIGGTVNRDVVVIPQNDELPELQMPRKTDRFVVDAFHKATVTSDRPCPVIDQIIAEMCV